MDASRASGNPTIVHDLISEDESDDNAHLIIHPRVDGVNGVHDLATLDGSEGDENSEDEWDVESLFEDTIEEMGDEHLYEGGELLHNHITTYLLYDPLNI